jgi:hypothetical protein
MRNYVKLERNFSLRATVEDSKFPCDLFSAIYCDFEIVISSELSGMSWRSYQESGEDQHEDNFLDRSVAVTMLPEEEELSSAADTTTRESINTPTNRRWYPGKFLGFKRRDSNGNLKPVERGNIPKANPY